MKGKKRLTTLLCLIATCALAVFAGGCGLKEKIEQAKCKNHDFGAVATTVDKEATCMETGQETWTCKLCGYEDERDIAMLDHTYDTGVETKAPTCTEKGEKKYTCVDCSATKTETVAKLPHNQVDVDTLAATCTKEGATAYSYCADCNSVLVPKKLIPALGHSEVTDMAVKETCTTPGLTEGKHCGVCGEVTKEQTEIAAKGHTVAVDKAVEATCTEEGKNAGSHCSACQEILVAQVVVPAKGHTYGNDNTCDVCGHHEHTLVTVPAVAPTCTVDGKLPGKKCSECGVIVEEQKVDPATGHTFNDNWVCTVCGVEHEHTAVALPVVPATCNSTGLTAGSECSVCGKTILAQQVIPKKEHVRVTLPTVAATCTTTGLTAGEECSLCGEILSAQAEVAALGHTEVVLPAVAATCTKTGLTEGKKCSVCNVTIKYQDVISISHTYNDFEECTTCGYVYETPVSYFNYEIMDNGLIEITGFSDNVGSSMKFPVLAIPKEIGGARVAAIRENAFVYRGTGTKSTKHIDKVILRGSTLFVGAYVFQFTDITTLVVDCKSVYFECDEARGAYQQFAYCYNLKNIIVGNTVSLWGTLETESGMGPDDLEEDMWAFYGSGENQNITLKIEEGTTTFPSMSSAFISIMEHSLVTILIPSGMDTTKLISYGFDDLGTVRYY